MNEVLTPHQEEAYKDILKFLVDKEKTIFILEGYSGTGKTTLIGHLLNRLDDLRKTYELLDDPLCFDYTELTATTNKAAEVLSSKCDVHTKTIHSLMKFRISYSQGKPNLVSTSPKEKIDNTLIIIDEASYIDNNLLTMISQKIGSNTKILFVGDPAQLVIKSREAPVFKIPVDSTKLTEVVRQKEDSPIIDLSTKFRNTVITGRFFSFKPDNKNIVLLDNDDWQQEVTAEFSDKNWSFHKSKILTYKNKTVIKYNQAIHNLRQGDPEVNVGDYVICNSFLSLPNGSIKTDQLVHVTEKHEAEEYGIFGYTYKLDDRFFVFMPKCLEDRKRTLKRFERNEDYVRMKQIESTWGDLRPAYSQTVHKSQGSTYDKVFIDLDDIKTCSNGNTLARMMYVAVSRAKDKVYMVGDLV